MTQLYQFNQPLQEALILKRKSQFTMDVLLNDQIITCHCPTTGRIGDIELKNIPCLLSESQDPKRKLKYTVEAISCDDVTTKTKSWVGINQILSNRLVEFFVSNHLLGDMFEEVGQVKREVSLGQSKLDFLVGNTYLEVKTPLTTLNVTYGNHIRTKKTTPFSSTSRFTKHIKELASSLKDHERALLVTVHQYQTTDKKPNQHSTNYKEVKEAMAYAIGKGLETWEIECQFLPEGVRLISCRNTTDTVLDY